MTVVENHVMALTVAVATQQTEKVNATPEGDLDSAHGKKEKR